MLSFSTTSKHLFYAAIQLLATMTDASAAVTQDNDGTGAEQSTSLWPCNLLRGNCKCHSTIIDCQSKSLSLKPSSVQPVSWIQSAFSDSCKKSLLRLHLSLTGVQPSSCHLLWQPIDQMGRRMGPTDRVSAGSTEHRVVLTYLSPFIECNARSSAREWVVNYHEKNRCTRYFTSINPITRIVPPLCLCGCDD